MIPRAASWENMNGRFLAIERVAEGDGDGEGRDGSEVTDGEDEGFDSESALWIGSAPLDLSATACVDLHNCEHRTLRIHPAPRRIKTKTHLTHSPSSTPLTPPIILSNIASNTSPIHAPKTAPGEVGAHAANQMGSPAVKCK